MSRETRLGLTLALGGLVIVLDTTVTIVAVPELVRVFDAPLATMQWTTAAYLLALVTTLPFAAWLGARVGTRTAYVAALLVFAAASAWAGLAHGPGELIAARVLQGLGGGLITPLGMTLGLRDVPTARRGRVASLLGLPVLVGPLVGPVLAGWLIEAVSWRAIFFVTVPPALLAAVLVRRFARDDETTERAPLDVAGALLLVPGAVAIVFGVGQATASPVVRITTVVAGLLLVVAFVSRSLRRPAPLLDVRLLARPVFAGALAVLVLFGAAYFGSMLLTPTYVQVTRGDSAVIAGSLGIPAGLATGLSLQVCTRLVDRVAPRRVVVTGLAVAASASGLGILVLRTDTSYVVLAGLAALLGLGAGAVLMPTMTAATRDLTGPALASGSAIMGLVQQLASAVGSAAITALFAGAVGWRTGGLGLEQVSRLSDPARATVAADLVTAQRLTQLATLALILLALAVAARWLGARRTEESPAPRASGGVMTQVTPELLATTLSVGEVAAECGVAPSAVRFYEKHGLVTAIRTTGNQRRFDAMAGCRIKVAKVAQRVGLTVREIVEVLATLPDEPTPEDWHLVATTLVTEARARIVALETTLVDLGSGTRLCQI